MDVNAVREQPGQPWSGPLTKQGGVTPAQRERWCSAVEGFICVAYGGGGCRKDLYTFDSTLFLFFLASESQAQAGGMR